LIVGELASKVVDHAHTIMTLRAAVRSSALYLAMHDGSSAPPILRTVTVPTERGRGLRLVEAVSSTWGYRLEHGGKTVWATLDLAGSGGMDTVSDDIERCESTEEDLRCVRDQEPPQRR
jgi:hypothetical protein